jgi:tetratricopeptide (TPR) repeat protein
MSTIAELFALAARCRQDGDMVGAEALYRQILCFEPGNADAGNNLANALFKQNRLAEAAEWYQRTLQLNPQYANAHFNLGNVLFAQGRLVEAEECFRQTLKVQPTFLDAHNNLGNALKYQGRLAEADASFRQALGVNSEHRPALWNRALLRLLQGDFAAGWADYEQRWNLPGAAARSLQQPRWDGSPLAGKSILVYAEQGYGDTIQFLRYLPLAQQRGGRVVFECPLALAALALEASGVDQLVRPGTPLPPIDLQIPLLSLPGLFGTTLANIPASVPYLQADAELVRKWEQLLARDDIGRMARRQPSGNPPLTVGIAWQGNPQFRGDVLRSIPLLFFESLAAVPGIRLVSLQKGAGVEQIHGLAGRFSIVNPSARLENFSDTAALMMNLDLVISSDTSIPHLAGALGIPVWTILQFVPDWRWLLDRPDSPWYPTMRLFRQYTFGDWGEVFERIARQVATFSPGSKNRA